MIQRFKTAWAVPQRRAMFFALTLSAVACTAYDEAAPGPYDAPPDGGTTSTTGGTASGTAGTTAPSGGTTTTPAGGTSASTAGTTTTPTAGTDSGVGGMAGAMAVAGASGSGGNGGTAGTGTDSCPGCAMALEQALKHRYDFEGSGTAVMDRVGTAHGSVVGGATLSVVEGKGAVVLPGGTNGSYVNLPNGIVSPLMSASFEAWLTWAGGAGWQRIFDFGDSTNAMPEDNPAEGNTYLFVTPQTDTSSGGVMRAVYSLDGGAAAAETRVEATGAVPVGLAQVVLVVDATAGALRLYQDGQKVGEQTFAGALGSLNDVNVWLGRSQYSADPELAGTFHDFRIYSAALTDAQIAFSFASGADPAFLAE